jgi:hypothetical protein
MVHNILQFIIRPDHVCSDNFLRVSLLRRRSVVIKKVVVMMILFLLAVLSLESCAPGKDRWMEYRREKPPVGTPPVADFLLMDLNLTEDQTSRIHALRETHLKEIGIFQKEMLTVREKTQKEGRAGQDGIEAANIIRDIQMKMQERRNVYLQEVQKVLTPAQKAMFRPDERGQKGAPEEGMEPGGRGGPGGGMRGSGQRRGSDGGWNW